MSSHAPVADAKRTRDVERARAILIRALGHRDTPGDEHLLTALTNLRRWLNDRKQNDRTPSAVE